MIALLFGSPIPLMLLWAEIDQAITTGVFANTTSPILRAQIFSVLATAIYFWPRGTVANASPRQH